LVVEHIVSYIKTFFFYLLDRPKKNRPKIERF
jgi:hypothetical protein